MFNPKCSRCFIPKIKTDYVWLVRRKSSLGRLSALIGSDWASAATLFRLLGSDSHSHSHSHSPVEAVVLASHMQVLAVRL